jgi:hypothetical protein
MCGIAGFIGLKNNIQLAENLIKIQRYSGPIISRCGTTFISRFNIKGSQLLI